MNSLRTSRVQRLGNCRNRRARGEHVVEHQDAWGWTALALPCKGGMDIRPPLHAIQISLLRCMPYPDHLPIQQWHVDLLRQAPAKQCGLIVPTHL